jgi:bacterioferritin-associated ferredoxin
MIVCLCHRVSDRDIARAAREGVTSFDVLQDDTRVASSCGSCHDCAREIFDKACAAHGTCSASVSQPLVAHNVRA